VTLAVGVLKKGQRVPDKREAAVSGPIRNKIKRTDPEFKKLVRNDNAKIVFKNEDDLRRGDCVTEGRPLGTRAAHVR
jgi:hypothetical protein